MTPLGMIKEKKGTGNKSYEECIMYIYVYCFLDNVEETTKLSSDLLLVDAGFLGYENNSRLGYCHADFDDELLVPKIYLISYLIL
jgi:hypothetical protein